MNKGELVEAIATKCEGATKKDVDAILTAAIDSIMDAVAAGDKVTIVGFGSFEPRQRAARDGRNPQTGQTLKIPATTVPAFSAGKQFKEAVTA
jgi:DNA-binding protein HU-beta